MERFRRVGARDWGIELGRAKVMKCVRRLGTKVGRTENQCAERRVRSEPLEGMPLTC